MALNVDEAGAGDQSRCVDDLAGVLDRDTTGRRERDDAPIDDGEVAVMPWIAPAVDDACAAD